MITTDDRDTWDRPGNQEILHFKQGPPGSQPNPWQKLALLEDYQTSYEEITPNSTGDPRSWKSFEHYKVRRLPQTSVFPTRSSFRSDLYHDYLGYGKHPRLGVTGIQYWAFGAPPISHHPFGEPGLPLSGLQELYAKRADGGFVPPPADLEALEQRALKALLPGIKSELSSINSLIELRDFKSLPRTLKNIGEFGDRTLKKHLDRIRILGSKGTLREILRGAADGYLQAQFAIMPLLSDISGIYSALSRLERRINDLVTRSGRVQRKHFAISWTEDSEHDESYNDWYSFLLDEAGSIPHTEYSLRRKTSVISAQFHVEIEYNYNFTQYQLEHARLNGLLDSLGITINPAIIWNAIRWSFLVDWVLGVSQWLKQFEVRNMEPKINIRRYLWSIKRQRDIFTFKQGRAPLTEWTSEVPLPTVRETAYRRHVGLPTASSLIASGVTQKEFTLGAALVLSRRRRRSQRKYMLPTAGTR